MNSNDVNKKTYFIGLPVIFAALIGFIAQFPSYAVFEPSVDPPSISDTLAPGQVGKYITMLETNVLEPDTALVDDVYPGEDCLKEGFKENIHYRPLQKDETRLNWEWEIQPHNDAIPGTYVCTAHWVVEYDLAVGTSLEVEVEQEIVIIVIIDPVEELDRLVDRIDSIDVSDGIKNSLTKKLEGAIKTLTNKDKTDVAEACGKITSFKNQLNAMIKTKSQLTEQGIEQVESMVRDATKLLNIVCP